MAWSKATDVLYAQKYLLDFEFKQEDTTWYLYDSFKVIRIPIHVNYFAVQMRKVDDTWVDVIKGPTNTAGAYGFLVPCRDGFLIIAGDDPSSPTNIVSIAVSYGKSDLAIYVKCLKGSVKVPLARAYVGDVGDNLNYETNGTVDTTTNEITLSSGQYALFWLLEKPSVGTIAFTDRYPYEGDDGTLKIEIDTVNYLTKYANDVFSTVTISIGVLINKTLRIVREGPVAVLTWFTDISNDALNLAFFIHTLSVNERKGYYESILSQGHPTWREVYLNDPNTGTWLAPGTIVNKVIGKRGDYILSGHEYAQLDTSDAKRITGRCTILVKSDPTNNWVEYYAAHVIKTETSCHNYDEVGVTTGFGVCAVRNKYQGTDQVSSEEVYNGTSWTTRTPPDGAYEWLTGYYAGHWTADQSAQGGPSTLYVFAKITDLWSSVVAPSPKLARWDRQTHFNMYPSEIADRDMSAGEVWGVGVHCVFGLSDYKEDAPPSPNRTTNDYFLTALYDGIVPRECKRNKLMLVVQGDYDVYICDYAGNRIGHLKLPDKFNYVLGTKLGFICSAGNKVYSIDFNRTLQFSTFAGSIVPIAELHKLNAIAFVVDSSLYLLKDAENPCELFASLGFEPLCGCTPDGENLVIGGIGKLVKVASDGTVTDLSVNLNLGVNDIVLGITYVPNLAKYYLLVYRSDVAETRIYETSDLTTFTDITDTIAPTMSPRYIVAQSNRVVIADHKYVYVYDGTNVTKFFVDDLTGIANDAILSLGVNANDEIFIGSMSGKLIKISPDLSTITDITGNVGLQADVPIIGIAFI